MAMLMALACAAALHAAAPQSTAAAQTVVVDRGGLQAVRIRMAAGAAEPLARQLYDIVIVPIEGTLTAEVDGQTSDTRPGVPVVIPRGAPYRIANHASSPATFVSVRVMKDDIKPAPVPETTGVTVVRNADSKYVRATTLRFERGGQLRGAGDPAKGPTLFVLIDAADVRMTIASTIDEPGKKRAGTVWLFDPGAAFGLTNTGSAPIEMVRISAPPSR